MIKKYRLQADGISLDGASVWRQGAQTQKYDFKRESTSVSIYTGYKQECVGFQFTIAAKGGGRTKIRFDISDNEFNSILKAMLSASPEKFIETYSNFGKELKKFIQSDVRVAPHIGSYGNITETVEEEDNTPFDFYTKAKAELLDVLALMIKKPR